MTIFKESIKRILKNKFKFSILLVAPFLFIAMFSLTDQFYLSVGIVDKDGSQLSQVLVESLEEAYKVVKIDENEVVDYTVSHNINYAIIIEKGFSERIISGKDTKIKEFYIMENSKIPSVRMLIDNYVNNMKILAKGIGFNKEKFENVFEDYVNGKLYTKIESKEEEENYKTSSAMGFLVQFMLYMSIITAGLILDDKSKGIFYRTFYAPISLKRYMLENLAAFVIVALIQVTVVFAFVKFVLKLSFSGSFISMYLLFCVFAVSCIAFGLWIISLFKKPIQAYAAVALLTTPLVMLGGCYWPSEMMPDLLRKISLFIPTTWVMEGANKLLYENNGIMGITLEIGILLLFTVIFLAAGLLKKVDVAK